MTCLSGSARSVCGSSFLSAKRVWTQRCQVRCRRRRRPSRRTPTSGRGCRTPVRCTPWCRPWDEKYKTTGWPRCADSDHGSPAASGSVKSGASSPGCSGMRLTLADGAWSRRGRLRLGSATDADPHGVPRQHLPLADGGGRARRGAEGGGAGRRGRGRQRGDRGLAPGGPTRPADGARRRRRGSDAARARAQGHDRRLPRLRPHPRGRRDRARRALRIAPDDTGRDRVRLFRDFEEGAVHVDIPDPYYGGRRASADVVTIARAGARGIVHHLAQRPLER